MARLLDIRLILLAILLAGVVWYLLLVATDASSSPEPGRFGELEAFVRDEMDASRIPGVGIAIVENGETVYAEGFGKDGHGNAITGQTPFWIGSNTKSFTALAVMQLVEAGQVHLDEPVVRYLPQFQTADPEESSRITVRHLLNQTSGFSRSDGIKPLLNESSAGIEEIVSELRAVKLNRPVGERYEYSNLNFVVLGRLVEVVSGETWQDYIQANIFDLLGMTNSYTTLEAAEANGLTATHRYAFGFPFESGGKYLPGLAPTGYLYSTAEDMARYLTMYLNDGSLDGATLLSPEGIEEMLTPNTNEASVSLNSNRFEFQYAQGWFVGQFGIADDARWHQGSLPHFTAWMVLLPETDQAAAVLINAGSQFEILGANQVMSRLPIGVVNILRGEPPVSGVSISRFFVVFNTVVVMLLAVQVWSLVRVIRREPALPRGRQLIPALGPLVWELGLSILLLLTYPSILGGSWGASFRSLPDLSLVVIAIAMLWLATGLARVVNLRAASRVARRDGRAARRASRRAGA